ncbi:hypothetical protein Tco_0423657, partial [Tanacetum coccineum]
KRFTDEPALVYSSPPGDDDDDIFDFNSDNDEWKKLLYGDSYNDTHSKNDKDSKTKSLIDEANIVESNVLPPQLLTSDSTLLEESFESSEIATCYPTNLIHYTTIISTNMLENKKKNLERESKERNKKES